ncbi:MAG: LamG domain-containing protein [Planctomycetota bacterium]
MLRFCYYSVISHLPESFFINGKGDVWSFETLPIVEITEPDLVGWWTLDEGQGTTAVDWSGHDNEGTLEGEPQWVEGKIGSALAFEGSRVIFGASDSLTADLFQGSFTLAGWINPKRTGNTWQQIFRAVMAAGSNDTLFINNDGRLSWRGRVAGAWAGGMCETAAEVVPADTWTHFAVTGDEISFRIYVDGVLSQEAGFQKTDGANVTYYIGGTAGGESYSGMVDELRVYNKVLTADEIQKVMRGDPLVAWDASPANGSSPDIDNALPLAWQPGDNASQHDVYFGTDLDAVTDADASDTTGVYRGRQNGTSFNPAEGVEWGGGPYYWRVDEVANDGTIAKGRIWSFTVADFLLIDDFESYTDNDAENEAIWQHWIDGYEVPTNGSQVGNLVPPYAERGNVHGGAQSMPLGYDNTLGVTYSEAALRLTSARDWTAHGVAELSLWFQGDPANGADSLYVAAKNANGQPVIVNNSDAAAAQINAWTEWVIPLQTFADRGLNLANVDEIIIGLGARGTASAASGTGQMLIDDIRLYRP